MENSRLRPPWGRYVAALSLLSVLIQAQPVRAQPVLPGSETGQREGDDKRNRGTWAALLAGYLALGALTTGAAYMLRDNVVGRGIAIGAAGWGGFGLGAGAGFGLAQWHGCDTADCSAAEGVITAVGALVGSTAGSIFGQIATRQAGMSRPDVTAAGVAPVLVFLTVGTVIDW